MRNKLKLLLRPVKVLSMRLIKPRLQPSHETKGIMKVRLSLMNFDEAGSFKRKAVEVKRVTSGE